MEHTLIWLRLLVGLLRVNLVDGLGGDGGGVQVDGAQGGWRASTSLLLGELVVLHRRRTGGPSGTQDLVGLAIQVSQVGGGRVGRKQEDGFLDAH